METKATDGIENSKIINEVITDRFDLRIPVSRSVFQQGKWVKVSAWVCFKNEDTYYLDDIVAKPKQ
jgi:hypothetical protein